MSKIFNKFFIIFFSLFILLGSSSCSGIVDFLTEVQQRAKEKGKQKEQKQPKSSVPIPNASSNPAETTEPPSASTIDTTALDTTTYAQSADEATGNKNQKIKVLSWNMCNVGNSKSDEELEFSAKLLQQYDILAIQEVSTGLPGARAITKLNGNLNQLGMKWDLVLSDPTSGKGKERYAFLWKTSKVKLSGRPWLVGASNLDEKLDREPYMARFKVGDGNLLIANFHAVPTSKNPEQEIELLYVLHNAYRKDNLLVMGDFNLAQSDAAFLPLKNKGYTPVLEEQKTSLRIKLKDDGYLANEYDNIFYETDAFQIRRSGIIDFVPRFKTLKEARQISDHLPVWCELTIR